MTRYSTTLVLSLLLLVQFCPNITHNKLLESIQYINHKLNKTTYETTHKTVHNRKRQEIPIEIHHTTLIKMIKILLDNTYFTFNNMTYKQTTGVSMGTNVGPDLANLFCCARELSYATQFPEIIPSLTHCSRYMDDLNTAACDPQKIIKMYDGLPLGEAPRSKDNNAIFLDLEIYNNNNKIITKMYRKEGNTYSYPHYLSHCPESIKKGVIIGEYIRTYNNNQNATDRNKDWKQSIQRFQARGYTRTYITKTIKSWKEKREKKEDNNKEEKEDNINNETQNETAFIHIPYNPRIIKTPIETALTRTTKPDLSIKIGWKATKKIKQQIAQLKRSK